MKRFGRATAVLGLLIIAAFTAWHVSLSPPAATLVDDVGPPENPTVLMSKTDASTGVTWKLVTYPSSAGDCVDALAWDSNGNGLGGLGGCGSSLAPLLAMQTEILADGLLSASLPSGEEVVYMVVGGRVECDTCFVEIEWVDGQVLRAEVSTGYFLGYRSDLLTTTAGMTSVEAKLFMETSVSSVTAENP